jgi:nicotinamidase-related amidase
LARTRITIGVLAVSAALLAVSPALTLRSRVQADGQWKAVPVTREFDPSKTALVICDMWDRHWCTGATGRVAALARKMEPVLQLARKHGVLIIHAPSETIAFYSQDPARVRMLKIPVFAPPAPLALNDPPLPIDDSDGGCDVPGNKLAPNTRVWSRENAALSIGSTDLISDSGPEIYSALKSYGIETLLFAGVHTNMCILNRTFGIRQMTRWGVHCVLIRDLTDAMYNPARAPQVSHSQGTELVIEHIEKYWAPTVTSEELARALASTPPSTSQKRGPSSLR